MGQRGLAGSLGLWLVAGLLAGTGARSVGPSATYDQRQEGKVNVQIDVKGVQIVALVDSDMLEDYTNYDYAYDYADFTIKPRPTTASKPTTTAASITSEAGWSTNPSTLGSVAPSEESSSTAASAALASSSATAVGIDSTPVGGTSAVDEGQQLETSTGTASPTGNKPDEVGAGGKRPQGLAEPRKRCPHGFLLKSGRCFKRRLALSS